LNVIFGKIFPKALLAFTRPKRARIYFYSRGRFLLRASDKTRAIALVRVEPRRGEKLAAAVDPQSKIAAANALDRRERLIFGYY
jgi:hypothetical protein